MQLWSKRAVAERCKHGRPVRGGKTQVSKREADPVNGEVFTQSRFAAESRANGSEEAAGLDEVLHVGDGVDGRGCQHCNGYVRLAEHG